jgi:hypothetical protein
MNAKDKMELEWWQSVKNRDHSVRYIKALELFGLKPFENVGLCSIDWGCGPLGGVLPYVKSQIKYGVDPLWDEYSNEIIDLCDIRILDLMLNTPDEIFSENYNGQFDTIFSVNAIDHGDSNFEILYKFQYLLDRGGMAYIHVHLRTKEQLNEGHDHCLTDEQLDEVLSRSKFEVISRNYFDTDPLPWSDNTEETDKYRTLIIILKKK